MSINQALAILAEPAPPDPEEQVREDKEAKLAECAARIKQEQEEYEQSVRASAEAHRKMGWALLKVWREGPTDAQWDQFLANCGCSREKAKRLMACAEAHPDSPPEKILLIAIGDHPATKEQRQWKYLLEAAFLPDEQWADRLMKYASDPDSIG